MELITLAHQELNTLRPHDIFFDPGTSKIYEYRNKEGKALLVREIGQSKITKVFKNTLGNVIKAAGEFEQYLLFNISDDFISVFNDTTGDTFDLGFGDAKEDLPEIKKDFENGKEITVHVFEYEDIKEVIKLEVTKPSTESVTTSSSGAEPKVDKELEKRIKEIEKRKAEKRPFTEPDPKTQEKSKKKPSGKKTTKKDKSKPTKKSTKKTSKKTTKKTRKKKSKK